MVVATQKRDAMLRAGVQADLASSRPSSTRPNPTPAERRAAFLALPEPVSQSAYEMQADGSIIQKMAPKPRHSAVQEEILFRFRAARARRIAQAYPKLRIVLAECDPRLGPRRRRLPLGAAPNRGRRAARRRGKPAT